MRTITPIYNFAGDKRKYLKNYRTDTFTNTEFVIHHNKPHIFSPYLQFISDAENINDEVKIETEIYGDDNHHTTDTLPRSIKVFL